MHKKENDENLKKIWKLQNEGIFETTKRNWIDYKIEKKEIGNDLKLHN